MWDLIARYPLAPVLIWQGLKLRRTALILPEAAGPRAGDAGTGRPLRLLVLGDSSAAGVGASVQDEALSGRLVSRLSGTWRVTWQLWAKTGATTKSTLSMLDAKPEAQFDVAVIALGVNDVTRGVGVARWMAQQARLRSVLRRKFGVRYMIVTAIPPIGQFPALSPLLRWILGSQATRFDTGLRRALANETDAAYLALDLGVDAGMMASDGFHPGPVIYDVWAREVATRVLAKGEETFL